MHDIAVVGHGDGWIVGDRVYGGGSWLRQAPTSEASGAYLPALLRGALDGG